MFVCLFQLQLVWLQQWGFHLQQHNGKNWKDKQWYTSTWWHLFLFLLIFSIHHLLPILLPHLSLLPIVCHFKTHFFFLSILCFFCMYLDEQTIVLPFLWVWHTYLKKLYRIVRLNTFTNYNLNVYFMRITASKLSNSTTFRSIHRIPTILVVGILWFGLNAVDLIL